MKEQVTSELVPRTAQFQTRQGPLCAIMKDNSGSHTALQATIEGEPEDLTQVSKQLSEARHQIAYFESENETRFVRFREKEVELIQINTLNEGHLEEEKSAHQQKRMRVQEGLVRERPLHLLPGRHASRARIVEAERSRGGAWSCSW
jgi:hypothetical protein